MSTSRDATTPHAHEGRAEREFVALGIGVLAVSDTRSLEDDRSGALLQEELEAAGHRCAARDVVPDDVAEIQERVRAWCAQEDVQAVLVTGGTGVTRRDVTPEALAGLYEKELPGFGELFRMLSYEEIGSSTIQSRASAGVVDGKLVFALPGSTGACRLGIRKIILPQLDNRTLPCSFVSLMDRM